MTVFTHFENKNFYYSYDSFISQKYEKNSPVATFRKINKMKKYIKVKEKKCSNLG